LLTLQRFNENRWRPFTAFLLKILDNVSSSGSGAGIAASRHRGRTLKGTKVSELYEYFKLIFVTIPEIFGSPSYNNSILLESECCRCDGDNSLQSSRIPRYIFDKPGTRYKIIK